MLGSRACDVLMTLIEASGAVVGKDEALEPRPAKQDVNQNRQARHELAQSARPPQRRQTSYCADSKINQIPLIAHDRPTGTGSRAGHPRKPVSHLQRNRLSESED